MHHSGALRFGWVGFCHQGKTGHGKTERALRKPRARARASTAGTAGTTWQQKCPRDRKRRGQGGQQQDILRGRLTSSFVHAYVHATYIPPYRTTYTTHLHRTRASGDINNPNIAYLVLVLSTAYPILSCLVLSCLFLSILSYPLLPCLASLRPTPLPPQGFPPGNAQYLLHFPRSWALA